MITKLAGLLIFIAVLPGCQPGTTSSTPSPPSLATPRSAPPAINSPAPNPPGLPTIQPIVLKSGIENGHPAGIRISIQTTKDTDTSTSYKLISSYENYPVGFMLVIPRDIDGKQKSQTAFIRSLGTPSDLFLQLLAKQYHQKIAPASKMADSIPFICMNLENFYGNPPPKPSDSTWIAAQYKLFFDAESEDGDAELFMNIVPGRWIEFAEKDDDYRSHLIRLFKRH